MNDNKLVNICPVCHKAFTNKEGCKISTTCSITCGKLFSQYDKYGRQRLLELAAELKRKPRTDCRSYDPERRCCTGLNALWCKYEECKFYKPRRKNSG